MQITNIKNETEDIIINSTDNKKIQKTLKHLTTLMKLMYLLKYKNSEAHHE